MSEENKMSRLTIEDLPQGEQELTAEEANDIRGGEFVRKDVQVSSFQSGPTEGSGATSRQVNGGDDILIAGSTSFGHVK